MAILGVSTLLFQGEIHFSCGQGEPPSFCPVSFFFFFFFCYSLGLLLNCSRELLVPLELHQLIWGSFSIVVEPTLELQWADPLQ